MCDLHNCLWQLYLRDSLDFGRRIGMLASRCCCSPRLPLEKSRGSKWDLVEGFSLKIKTDISQCLVSLSILQLENESRIVRMGPTRILWPGRVGIGQACGVGLQYARAGRRLWPGQPHRKTTFSPVETYAYLGRTSVTPATQSCLASRPFRTSCHSAQGAD